MVQQQLRQVGMNRLALACVTAVRLVDVALLGGDAAAVMRIYLDGVGLSFVVVVNEMMSCMSVGVVDDDEHVPVVARLEDGSKVLMMTNIFELYDLQL